MLISIFSDTKDFKFQCVYANVFQYVQKDHYFLSVLFIKVTPIFPTVFSNCCLIISDDEITGLDHCENPAKGNIWMTRSYSYKKHLLFLSNLFYNFNLYLEIKEEF